MPQLPGLPPVLALTSVSPHANAHVSSRTPRGPHLVAMPSLPSLFPLLFRHAPPTSARPLAGSHAPALNDEAIFPVLHRLDSARPPLQATDSRQHELAGPPPSPRV